MMTLDSLHRVEILCQIDSTLYRMPVVLALRYAFDTLVIHSSASSFLKRPRQYLRARGIIGLSGRAAFRRSPSPAAGQTNRRISRLGRPLGSWKGRAGTADESCRANRVGRIATKSGYAWRGTISRWNVVSVSSRGWREQVAPQANRTDVVPCVRDRSGDVSAHLPGRHGAPIKLLPVCALRYNITYSFNKHDRRTQDTNTIQYNP